MPTNRQPIRFGIFEVDLLVGELRRNGTRVKLQEQPFQVLAALLERPGEIVTKEELQERIWKEDTFVDFDRSLATAVNKVRQALGDSATRPRFIETVPKRGYRFMGSTESRTSSAFHLGRRVRYGQAIAIASAVLFVIGGGYWAYEYEADTSKETSPIVEPLTTFPGLERYPSISPDGSRVAFAWKREDDEQFDIYVKLIGPGEPTRLTTDPADDLAPLWSPDGHHIAFERSTEKDRLTVIQVPSMGGRETVLTHYARTPFPHQERRFCWTPAGDALVVSDIANSDEAFGLFYHALSSGKRSRLTRPGPESIGDFDPSINSNGGMSFVRQSLAGDPEIFFWEIGDPSDARGSPESLVSMPFDIQSPVISPQNDEVVFSAWAPMPAIWRQSLSPGRAPERVLGAGKQAIHPTFSSDGSMLVHSTWNWSHDIWRLELSQPAVAARPPERLIYSTYDDMWADYSPDERQIAFQSTRGGSHQVWVCDAEGRNCAQLTSMNSSMTGSPRWSPDGSQIAFDSAMGKNFALFVMNSNGSGMRRLTDPSYGASSPLWSRDGGWLFYTYFGNVLAQRGAWRVPVSGGTPELLSKEIGGKMKIDEADRYLYGTKQDRTLWRLSLESRELTRVLDDPVAGFTLVPEGVYFSGPGAGASRTEISFYRFADRTISKVATAPLSTAERFSISRDGRNLLFTQDQDVNSDLMLIRNYR